MAAGDSKPFKGTKMATRPTGGETKSSPVKVVKSPNPGEAKATKPPIGRAARPTPGHQGGTRVGRMELHNTPSEHAQRILKGSGRLVGPGDNFATPGNEGSGGARRAR